jgi:cytochrome c-type biogenesis protein
VQTSAKPAGFFGAMLVGVAFAVRLDPMHRARSSRRFWLWPPPRIRSAKASSCSPVYSAGLGVPFIATSLAINKFFAASARIRKHYHAIEVVSGVLLVAVGVLIFTNRFTVIAQLLTPYFPTF